MSNFKNRILPVFYLGLILFGCKPGASLFTFEDQVNNDFFSRIGKITGDDPWHIDSIKVYRAVLTERLVERDRIPEYKLFNEESKKPFVKFEIDGNYHHLYLFHLYNAGVNKNICVFLSASFDATNTCRGFGAAYLGYVRKSELNMERKLKTSKEDKQFILEPGKKFDSYFNADSNILAQPEAFRIWQIIRDEENKIGGRKELVFNIGKVFNDTDALKFRLYTTLRLNRP